MICYSIFSKVWLLALVWRRTCSLANRIPMIPVFTCLFCLFLAAFLAEIAQTDMAYFIPSRVLVGLGAVCFTLFSIVSILEAGSAKNNKRLQIRRWAPYLVLFRLIPLVSRAHFASYSATKSCAQAHALDHAHWKL